MRIKRIKWNFQQTFFQIKKNGNWHIATDTLVAIIKAQRQLFTGNFEIPFISVQCIIY